MKEEMKMHDLTPDKASPDIYKDSSGGDHSFDVNKRLIKFTGDMITRQGPTTEQMADKLDLEKINEAVNDEEAN